MSAELILYYDEFHTPSGPLAAEMPDALVLDIDLGGQGTAPAALDVQRIDAVGEFCERFLLRAIKAHAVYGGGYVLSSALSRPLQAEICIRAARERAAGVIVHGLAGNDQLRFEMAVAALAPDLEVRSVAAVLGSQNARNAGAFTISENIWGRSVEAGPLDDPGQAPPELAYAWCAAPGAGTGCERVEIEFEAGRPVALDGAALELAAIIAELNLRAGALGIGVADTVEDGFVGLKSRALYEAPAATVLIAAHRDLERIVCSRRENAFKAEADRCWTEIVYDGFWFDPARASLETYIEALNARVTGVVELVLQPGGVQAVTRRAAAALYDEHEAIYRAGQDYGVAAMAAAARMLSSPMRAAVAQGREALDTGGVPWSA